MADSKPEEEDYDPYKHRDVDVPVSTFNTYLHFIKSSIGTGILAIPLGFAENGYVPGVAALIIMSVVVTYCIHIVFRVEYQIAKSLRQPYISYKDAVIAAVESGPEWLTKCSKCLGYAVDWCLVGYQLGVGCVYIIFVSMNLKVSIDHYTGKDIPIEVYATTILLPLLVLMLIPNLKLLAPVSGVANLFLLVSFFCMFYYIFRGLPNLFKERDAFENILRLPIFFGTVMFAVLTIGPYVTLESKMKDPAAFCKPFGVLNVGMSIVVVIYAMVAFFAYWKYGKDTKATITVNFPEDEVLGEMIRLIYSLTIYFGFAIHMFVPFDILWHTYIRHRVEAAGKNLLFWEYVLRISMVLFVYLLAVIIPYLDVVISLLGTFAIAALGFFFPPLMELCWLYPDNYGTYKHMLIIDLVVFLVGIFGIISGTYSNLVDLVKRLHARMKKFSSMDDMTFII